MLDKCLIYIVNILDGFCKARFCSIQPILYLKWVFQIIAIYIININDIKKQIHPQLFLHIFTDNLFGSSN